MPDKPGAAQFELGADQVIQDWREALVVEVKIFAGKQFGILLSFARATVDFEVEAADDTQITSKLPFAVLSAFRTCLPDVFVELIVVAELEVKSRIAAVEE